MAIPTIKATYSLDTATVRALEKLAKRWGISKSEVVRRAIRQAARSREPLNGAIDALNQVQSMLSEEGLAVDKWAQQVKNERRNSEKSRHGSDTS